MTGIRPKTIVVPLVIAAILTIFYWPTFRWLYNSWTAGGFLNNDNPYGHAFLLPLISAFIIWTKREHLRSPQPSAVGVGVLGLGAVVYLLGAPWILDLKAVGGLSLVIVISGLSLAILGLRATKTIAFPLLFLVLMIPPPFISDLTYDLQRISTDFSVSLAEALRLDVTTEKFTIYVGELKTSEYALDVGPACSGINSLVALVSLAAVYAYILKGSVPRRVAIFILAWPIAILGNTLRITDIIMRAENRGIESATALHDWSDPLFFATAIALLVVASRMLGLVGGGDSASGGRQRSPFLLAWLVLVAITNAVGALFYLAGSGITAETLPDASAWTIGALTVLGIVNVACAVAVLAWRRWGFYGLCFSTLVVTIISFVSGASLVESLGILIAPVILYGLLRIGRERNAWAQLK